MKLSPEQFDQEYNKDNQQVDIIVEDCLVNRILSQENDKNDPRNALFTEYVSLFGLFRSRLLLWRM